MTKKGHNYKDSGVNIEEGQSFVRDIQNSTSRTKHRYSMGSIGGFSGYIQPPTAFKNPVYALACDGVGTKLNLAVKMGDFSSIGIDLVAMCVNDLIVSGARPLAFLDYYGVSKLERSKGKEIITGILEGCRLAECDLVGGETAEMPNHYAPNCFDLVGFAMGINEKEKIVDGKQIEPGDKIVGIPSSGFHSNGYSLIHNVLETTQPSQELISELLTPTRIYVREILDLLSKYNIKGMAHITGGGLDENLSRVPTRNSLEIDSKSWELPPIFQKIQSLGNISDTEMFNVFNCGIGFCLILNSEETDTLLAQENDYIEIGVITDPSEKKFILK